MLDPNYLPPVRPTAPPRLPPADRGPVLVGIPGVGSKSMPYEEAEKMHRELGQALARGLRVRGSSNPPTPDIGGTPVAVAA